MRTPRALLPLVITSLVLATGCADVVMHPDIDAIVATHDRVAVLPPAVDQQRRRLPRDVTPADVRASELATSAHLHGVAVRAAREHSDSVQGPTWQTAQGTRDRLADAGISPGAAAAAPSDDLVDVLGVDAVLMTDVGIQRYLSDGAAVTLEILGGLGGGDAEVPTHEIEVRMTLVDHASGEPVWTCDHWDQIEVIGEPDRAAARLVRECAAELPYE